MHSFQETIAGDVSNIVQTFITKIGLPTISRFANCYRNTWPPPASQHAHVVPLYQHGLLPRAQPPASNVFVYHGKAAASIGSHDVESSSEVRDMAERIDLLEEELDVTRHALLEAQGRENALIVQVNTLRQLADSYAKTALRKGSEARGQQHSMLSSVAKEQPTVSHSIGPPPLPPRPFFERPPEHPTTPTTPRSEKRTGITPAKAPFQMKQSPFSPPSIHRNPIHELHEFLATHNLLHIYSGILILQSGALSVLNWGFQLDKLGVPENLIPSLIDLIANTVGTSQAVVPDFA